MGDLTLNELPQQLCNTSHSLHRKRRDITEHGMQLRNTISLGKELEIISNCTFVLM